LLFSPAVERRPDAKFVRVFVNNVAAIGRENDLQSWFVDAEPPAGGGCAKTLAPASFRRRWNSGDAMMIVPAAARRRSTASAGKTNDVGCWFR
jgi:hypothetical protein